MYLLLSWAPSTAAFPVGAPFLDVLPTSDVVATLTIIATALEAGRTVRIYLAENGTLAQVYPAVVESIVGEPELVAKS